MGRGHAWHVSYPPCAVRAIAASRVGSYPSHFLRRRFFAFLGDVLREATVFLTAKSSSFAPALSFSRSQTGCAPRPAHVLPALSRYLIGTFRPFIALPRARSPVPTPSPSLESCCCS